MVRRINLRWLLPALLFTACADSAPSIEYAEPEVAAAGGGKADGLWVESWNEPIENVLCREPSAATCFKVDYMESECGQRFREACGRIAYDVARGAAENMPVARIRGVESRVEEVPDTPIDRTTFAMTLSGDESVRLSSEKLRHDAARVDGMPEKIGNLRAAWGGNGRIDSCAEYAYEKYRDHAHYEDVIAAAALDPRRAFAITIHDFPDIDEALDAEGNPLPRPERMAKNAYFAAPESLFDSPDEAAAGREGYEDSLGVHVELSERLQEVPDVELDARYDMSLAFADRVEERAQLVAERDAVREVMEGDGCVPDDSPIELDLGDDAEPLLPCFEGRMVDFEVLARLEGHLSERLAGMDDALRADLAEARDAGCLDRDSIACDWSPRRFVDQVRGRHDDAREAAFQRCKTLIEDVEVEGLPDIANRTLRYDDGDLYFAAVDYPLTFSLVDLYMDRVEPLPAINKARAEAAAEAARQAAIEREETIAQRKREADAKAAMSKVGGGLKKLHQKFANTSKSGNDKFNFASRYLLEWRVWDFSQVLCNLNAKFEALFEVSVTVFKKFELIYTRFYLDLHKYEGDLRILNGSVVNYRKRKQLVGQLKWNLVKGKAGPHKAEAKASAYFTIVAIPVKVSGGLAGTLGMSYSVDAEIAVDGSGATCNSVDAKLVGKVRPFANIKGFAELAIELFVARVGIGGRLLLVEVSLPGKASIGLTAPNGDIRDLRLRIAAGLDLAVEALRGALYIWGEVGWCPFCLKGKADIFKWSGLKWKTKVFKTQLDLPLFGLASIGGS